MPIVNKVFLGYTQQIFWFGRWNPWRIVDSRHVKNAVKEFWCLFLTLAVKEHLSITKHGYAPILIAAIMSKSGMVTYI
jgi:hypothetical protein